MIMLIAGFFIATQLTMFDIPAVPGQMNGLIGILVTVAVAVFLGELISNKVFGVTAVFIAMLPPFSKEEAERRKQIKREVLDRMVDKNIQSYKCGWCGHHWLATGLVPCSKCGSKSARIQETCLHLKRFYKEKEVIMSETEGGPEPSPVTKEILEHIDTIKELIVNVDIVVHSANRELASLRELLDRLMKKDF